MTQKPVAARYLVDCLLWSTTSVVAVVGLLLGFVIPRGGGVPPEQKVFLGLHRHQWCNIHLVFALLLVLLVLIHLSFNWRWVTEVSKRLFEHRWRRALALISLAWVGALALAWLVTKI